METICAELVNVDPLWDVGNWSDFLSSVLTVFTIADELWMFSLLLSLAIIIIVIGWIISFVRERDETI